MSIDELKTSGYNEEEILEIKKNDYAQEIKKRAELPEDQLRNSILQSQRANQKDLIE